MQRTSSFVALRLAILATALAVGSDALAEQKRADTHAFTPESEVMARAFPEGGVRPEDVANVQLLAARNVVQKALGEDSRDLVFIPVTPCTVWDSRFATDPNSAGLITPGQTKRFYSHQDGAGGSYATWGGNPSCPETSLNSIGPRPFAVLMTIYINDATANGWLTIYRDGDTDPSLSTISVYYSPGPTRTQTVISKSSRGYGTGTYDVAATSRFGSTNAAAAVTGYFVKVEDVGTVTSVGTGPGLTGGPITTVGTINLAATNLLPTTACAATQIPKWNGTAWACAADLDTNAGGTVTAVTASSPLASSGGNTPNISLTGIVPVANGGTGQATLEANGVVYGQGTAAVGTTVGVVGDVLTGTAGAPAWTGSPSISGNLTLATFSTAIAGNIMKGTNRFMHNFGTGNTFLGENSGNFSMTGASNTVIGADAFPNNTTGASNTATGVQALLGNTTGSQNTAIGISTLQANTTGDSNVALGYRALFANTNGFSNTAGGSGTLISNTSGFANTASGAAALTSNTTGGGNTGIGVSSLTNNTTGSNNIALGQGSGMSLTTGNNNISIGNAGVAAEALTIRIGNTQSRAFIAGIRGVTTGLVNGVTVLIDSNGQLGTVSSSRRFKDEIADMDAASSALMKLRPVTFHYKTDAQHTLQYGLIAEEVADVYPGLVAHSADGQVETVMYQFLPSMLLNEYQKQQRTVEKQSAQMTRQVAEMARQSTEMTRQAAEIARQKQIIVELRSDRQSQDARIDVLEKRSAEQAAHMAKVLDRLHRSDVVSAGLDLK